LLVSSENDAGDTEPGIPSLFVGHYAESEGEHYVSLAHPVE